MEAVENNSVDIQREEEIVQSTEDRVSVREKVCYGVGDIGANLVWTTVASFLTIYCTDVAGIAAGVVGTLMLIARLFDGVSDLFMGVIIDKTNTRWGKARPWVLWSAPPLVISLIMIFTVPDISDNGKAIYMLLVYIFLAAVCFTASNLSYNTMLSLVTVEQHDRNVMNTFRFEFTMIAQLVINVITIPLVHFLGNGQKGWTCMSIIYAIVALGMFITTFAGTKERYKPIKKEVTKKEKKHPIKTVKILCKNKYFILITLAFAVIYVSLGLTSGSRIYYAKYVLGNEMLNSTMTMFNYIPTILTIMLVPVFANKFGKIKALFIGFLFYAAGLVFEIAGPTALTMIYTGLVLQGIGHAALYSCLFAIVGDVVDYSEWKDGIREEGLTYSVTSFGQKIGTGLGTAALGWILAVGNYNGTAAIQPDSAIFAIKALFLYLPLVITVIVLIIWYLFMGIDKIYPTVKKELQERRETVK
ncbi:glycoside-pentoside-hexuronide (GPH):cation symporter [Firmicutes bacterium i23-0019-B6]